VSVCVCIVPGLKAPLKQRGGLPGSGDVPLFPRVPPGAAGCQPRSGRAGGFHTPSVGLLPARRALTGSFSRCVGDIPHSTLCLSGTKALLTCPQVLPLR